MTPCHFAVERHNTRVRATLGAPHNRIGGHPTSVNVEVSAGMLTAIADYLTQPRAWSLTIAATGTITRHPETEAVDEVVLTWQHTDDWRVLVTARSSDNRSCHPIGTYNTADVNLALHQLDALT